LEKVL